MQLVRLALTSSIQERQGEPGAKGLFSIYVWKKIPYLASKERRQAGYRHDVLQVTSTPNS